MIIKTNILGVLIKYWALCYKLNMNYVISSPQHLYEVSLSPFYSEKTEAQRDQGICSKSLYPKINIQ